MAAIPKIPINKTISGTQKSLPLFTMLLRNTKKEPASINLRRNWSKYSKEKLLEELSNCEMNWVINDVQSNWNKIEEVLINTTDKLAPLCEFMDNVSKESQIIPSIIKRKMSHRKRLVAKLRQNPSEMMKKHSVQQTSMFKW